MYICILNYDDDDGHYDSMFQWLAMSIPSSGGQGVVLGTFIHPPLNFLPQVKVTMCDIVLPELVYSALYIWMRMMMMISDDGHYLSMFQWLAIPIPSVVERVFCGHLHSHSLELP